MNNPFFRNNGPFKLSELLKDNIEYLKSFNEIPKIDNFIHDVKNLNEATSNDITFFHSIKYKDLAIKTNAYACITKSDFFHLLPKECIKIPSDNVLLSTAIITAKFYPNSITDDNNFEACKTCVETFLMGIQDDKPRCMDNSCKKVWTFQFISEQFSMSFHNNKYH